MGMVMHMRVLVLPWVHYCGVNWLSHRTEVMRCSLSEVVHRVMSQSAGSGADCQRRTCDSHAGWNCRSSVVRVSPTCMFSPPLCNHLLKYITGQSWFSWSASPVSWAAATLIGRWIKVDVGFCWGGFHFCVKVGEEVRCATLSSKSSWS